MILDDFVSFKYVDYHIVFQVNMRISKLQNCVSGLFSGSRIRSGRLISKDVFDVFLEVIRFDGTGAHGDLLANTGGVQVFLKQGSDQDSTKSGDGFGTNGLVFKDAAQSNSSLLKNILND